MKPKYLKTLPLAQIKPHPELKKFFPAIRKIIEQIKENMRHEGFRSEEPIVVWLHQSTNVWYVVDGHQRYLAAVELGLEFVFVAIADFTDESEIIEYLKRRQLDRRQTDNASILNALLNATLYRRGRVPTKVPSGTSMDAAGDKPASLDEIAQFLGKPRRTVARVKSLYFDVMTQAEKNKTKSGETQIELIMTAIDDRRPRSATPPIFRLFSQIGLKEDETKKLMKRAEENGVTPREFAAEVLRQSFTENPSGVTDASSETVPPANSMVSTPQGADSSVEVTNEQQSDPLQQSTPSDGQDGVVETPKVTKDRDHKRWNHCQRELLMHFHVINPGAERIEVARAYHAAEATLMGDKCHQLPAVTQELYRLLTQFSEGELPPPLGEMEMLIRQETIRNLVAV